MGASVCMIRAIQPEAFMDTRTPRLSPNLLSLVLLAAFAASAHASLIIGIDLATGEALEASDVAGLDPASNWNNPTGFSNFTNQALVDNNDDATGATATAAGFTLNGNSFVGVTTDPNTEMFARGIRIDNSGSSSLSVSGLDIVDFPLYDVILYMSAISGGSEDTLTMGVTVNGGTAMSFLLDGDASNYSGSFVEATDTTQGNYARFAGLTGSDFDLALTSSALNGTLITGMQIVAIPEPSGLLLLLGACGCLLLRRRRR